MRILDVPNNEQPLFRIQAAELIDQVAGQYKFPLNESIERLDEEDLDHLGYFEEGYTWSFDEPSLELTLSDSDRTVSIPLGEITHQRRLNLVDETTVSPTADNPKKRSIQKVVVDCGYGTDIKQIIDDAYRQGLRKCWGARPSCGATDVIMDYGLDPDIEISTIGFENEEGDRIEVLYLGKGTTDVDFVHHATRVIATQEEYDMKPMDIEDL